MMPDDEREPRDWAHADGALWRPTGLLSLVCGAVAVPLLLYDDTLSRNAGYTGLRHIVAPAAIWGGFALACCVSTLVARLLRSQALGLMALLIQSAFMLVIAWSLLRYAPHSLGYMVFGPVGLWGLGYAGEVLRGLRAAQRSRGGR